MRVGPGLTNINTGKVRNTFDPRSETRILKSKNSNPHLLQTLPMFDGRFPIFVARVSLYGRTATCRDALSI